MTTPCSGEIGVSHINTELNTVGAARTLGQADGRTLCGVASGSIALSDYYCRSSAMNAIGGIISTYVDGNGWTWKVHTFWSTGTFQVISLGSNPVVEFLLISGGGSGGTPVGSPPRGAAGGGGGGTYFAGSFSVSIGAYIANVGLGGVTNANGGQSSIFGVSRPGGGSGGRYQGISGFNGSSGGGGGQGGWGTANPTMHVTLGGISTTGPGNAGGRSLVNAYQTNGGGGGGGGTAAAGGDSRPIAFSQGIAYTAGGHGANGVVMSFANSLHPVGAGGGGAGANTSNNEYFPSWDGSVPGGPPGDGGVCPNGGTNYPSGGKGTDFMGDTITIGNGAAGVNGTGGGGGGGSFLVPGRPGGSGKIVIRYRIA